MAQDPGGRACRRGGAWTTWVADVVEVVIVVPFPMVIPASEAGRLPQAVADVVSAAPGFERSDRGLFADGATGLG
jgi:hypothetical protein